MPTIYCSYNKLEKIEKIVPNSRNPNKHPKKQIELLAKIIDAQGWRVPITVSKRSGYVVRGHGRLEAARLLKLDEVPVDYQDYATEAEEYADLIADNRIAEIAEIDVPTLKDLLQEIDTGEIDMDLTGFTALDLEMLMSQIHQENQEDRKGKKEKESKTVICPECGHQFNVFTVKE